MRASLTVYGAAARRPWPPRSPQDAHAYRHHHLRRYPLELEVYALWLLTNGARPIDVARTLELPPSTLREWAKRNGNTFDRRHLNTAGQPTSRGGGERSGRLLGALPVPTGTGG